MLILNINSLKKHYGDRQVLNIKDLKVYSEDKIGIVGLNGSGKTTLLNLISKDISPDDGFIKTYGNISYIKQMGDAENSIVDRKYISEFGLKNKKQDFMSGGERTRLKIAKSLSKNCNLLLADEPTSNLDLEGISILLDKLLVFDGGLLMVSHDRDLLDKVCNKIIELEDGHLKLYQGNYSDYKKQKNLENKTNEIE